MTWLALIGLALKIIGIIIENRKTSQEQIAQAIVDGLSAKLDAVNKYASQQGVEAAHATAELEASKKKMSDFDKGGKW